MGETPTDALPTGTVSFLFTDIEGSTRLHRALGPTYEDVLDQHRDICRRAFADHDGAEVGCPGDGFVVAFASASDAIAAAVDAQRELASFPWPSGVAVRVRMGIHTGSARVTSTGGTYIGMALHEAARVGGAGHGGQILISEPTFRLAEHDLPTGVSALGLGEHELKDIEGGRRLYELRGSGLPGDFPPPRTRAAAAGNLPTDPSSFLGRAGDLAAVCRASTATRLVTLVGPGGIGKTRLALAAAAKLHAQFADGAWFADLSALPRNSSSDDIAVAFGAALAVEVVGGVSGLVAAMSRRSALLIVDNCEHLVESAADVVSAVLREAPDLRVIATSREALGVPGEHLHAVAPLPDDEAVALFVARANEVAPEFDATDVVLSDIERVCKRLDRLPLAIELAARRIRTLTPAAIADRLDDRFALLTGGDRTSPDRRRTLEAVVDWSHDLLTDNERVLLRRLAVFAGGCSLEAAETVCGVAPLTSSRVLDLLTALVDRSLVTVDRSGPEVRFTMLETIRAYAGARLTESGERDLLRQMHLSWFAALSWEALQAMGFGAGHQFNQMANEADNLRGAIAWALEGGDKDEGLRLAAGAAIFGMETGGNFFFASRTWIEQLLAAGGGAGDPALRCQALSSSCNVAGAQGDTDAVIRNGEAALALALRHELPPLLHSQAVGVLALGLEAQDPERSLTLYRESADLAEEGGARGFRVYVLSFLADAAIAVGRIDEARAAAEEGLDLGRRIGSASGIARSLNVLATITRLEGDVPSSMLLAEEAVATAGAVGAGSEVARGEINLAQGAFAAHDVARSVEHLGRAVERLTEVGQWFGVVRVWAGTEALLLSAGETELARVVVDRLIAAAEVVGATASVVAVVENVAVAAEGAGLTDLAQRLRAAT